MTRASPTCVSSVPVFCQGATISGHDVQRGLLLMGKVQIGAQCIVGACSQVMPGAKMADGVELAPLSVMSSTQVTNPDEFWEGSPAELVAEREPRLPSQGRTPCLALLQFCFLMVLFMMIGGSFFVSYLISIPISDAASSSLGNLFLLTLGTIPFALSFLILALVLKWLVLGKVRAGVYDRNAWNLARFWVIDTVMQCSIMNMGISICLDATVGVPTYLRLLGTKLGKNCVLFYPQLRVGLDLMELRDFSMFGGQVPNRASKSRVRNGVHDGASSILIFPPDLHLHLYML